MRSSIRIEQDAEPIDGVLLAARLRQRTRALMAPVSTICLTVS
jgi:hypothetical protein